MLSATLDPTVADRLASFTADHAGWVLPLVALVGLLKSLPIVALFVPSTAFFVALSAAYSAGGGGFTPLWLAAATGATTGDLLGYAVGRQYRHLAPLIWPLTRAPQLLRRGETLFRTWGIGSVLGAKFVWGVRPFIPIVAGTYRMPLVLFLAATHLSSMIWAAIGMGAGYGLWRLWA